MTAPGTDFDLVDDPWILALDTAGKPCTLTLRGALHRADEISTLTGEVPTQVFAILRLLLAVLRRSIHERTEPTYEIWSGLWTSDTLPIAEIDDYLGKHAGRFRLFDPDAPFFQVAGLRSDKDAVSSLDRLIADVPNGEKYFTTRAGASIDRIGFAEAARWLVHAQAFDPSGIKTGAVGDRRVKGGKGYPIGVAWTGNLGGVFLEGTTLRETLLLNLVLRDINSERFSIDDRPAWERDPTGPGAVEGRRPAGPADLCTWQSRRIRLVHNQTEVTGVVLCNGDALEPFNWQHLEPMTGWRYSEIQSKKARETRHYPITHDPERGLWRGFTSLVRQIGNTGSTEGRPIAPALLEWACYLIDEGVLNEAHPMRLHAIGMQYVNNQSVVGDIVDDTLGFRAALLASNPDLRVTAIDAVQVSDSAVDTLGALAANLALAAGGVPDGARRRAREHGFFALEHPYRQWLAALLPEGNTETYGQHWQRQVRQVIETIGTDLIESAGRPAHLGRVVGERYLDASLASIWFYGRLKKLLPAAYLGGTERGRNIA
ncbi:type I-E CRISPR-associated protein Cse1/CasA [Nocardia uniformis]|uniref:Type I-E CRISPR-associated protein Cse1/CasA n=1 Tax=Nocardia uniformis TaxID=53432 RepID=A0A849C3Z1_9NOCA|nr:type I-E CRISPR-associated protein Cse1/CasA [Nocardia uniformis]NNH72316.1 type I-E CRISPR-associated protein Cse1/CasA [Nocardia uniformis]